MAVALVDQAAAALHPTLVARVLSAICNTAQAVATETGTTANHANRSLLATKVATAPTSYVNQFANLITAQGVDNTSTDAQILSMISAVWNVVAGGL